MKIVLLMIVVSVFISSAVLANEWIIYPEQLNINTTYMGLEFKDPNICLNLKHNYTCTREYNIKESPLLKGYLTLYNNEKNILLVEVVNSKNKPLTPTECLQTGQKMSFNCQEYCKFVASSWDCNINDCIEGLEIIEKCIDNSTIMTHKCVNHIWVPTNNKCKIECNPYDYKTETCWNGRQIVIKRCTLGKWVDTNEKCEDNPGCIGTQVKTLRCDKKTTIISHICVNGKWLSTGNKCLNQVMEPETQTSLVIVLTLVLIAGFIIYLVKEND